MSKSPAAAKSGAFCFIMMLVFLATSLSLGGLSIEEASGDLLHMTSVSLFS